MNIDAYSLSDIGYARVRNEDATAACPDIGFWCIADGMGGLPCGGVASRVLCRSMEDGMRRGLGLIQSIAQADRAVFQEGRNNPPCTGLGSTVVAVEIKGAVFSLAWVGDSRCYHMAATEDAELSMLSRDHGHLGGLYRYMGTGTLRRGDVDLVVGRLHPGDMLVLCSDGLSSELSRTQMMALCKEHRARGAGATAVALARAALLAGGHDNVTVQILILRPEP